MPIRRGVDKDGSFYKWGEKGKKYYYTPDSDVSREHAKKKALKQGLAIGDFPKE